MPPDDVVSVFGGWLDTTDLQTSVDVGNDCCGGSDSTDIVVGESHGG